MKVMVARFSKKHPKQEYVLDAFDKLKALAQQVVGDAIFNCQVTNSLFWVMPLTYSATKVHIDETNNKVIVVTKENNLKATRYS